MLTWTFRALVTHAFILLPSASLADSSTSTTTITRTVVYQTSTTTLSTGTDAGPVPSASPDVGPYSPVKLQSSALNSTNYFRSQFLAKPLKWDSTLAAFAQQHAEKCLWEHSGGPYGENLALNFQTPALGIDAWADEEKKYRYPSEGFSEETGHFTQLVWQNTTRLGCGAVNCDNDAPNGAKGWFLVCEYNPPGNVEGGYRWNVQKPGESDDGKLGFGAQSAAPSSQRSSHLLVALVAASCLAVIWL